MELVRYILEIPAPGIVQADRGQDHVAASTQAIKDRFAAQGNIGATPLTDEPDKGYHDASRRRHVAALAVGVHVILRGAQSTKRETGCGRRQNGQPRCMLVCC